MSSKLKRQSFLVEVPSGNSQIARFSTVRLGRRLFNVASLFSQKTASKNRPVWLTLTPKSPSEGQNPWDWAHELASKLQSFSNEPVYIEPDFEQEFPYLNREGEKIESHSTASQCSVNEPDSSWPSKPSFAWHLGDEYSQLKAAREAVGDLARVVRIAILDTGYDPNHVSKPSFINLDLAWNFVEENSNATDPGKRGILYNPGHGTGTIALLAGGFVNVDHNDLRHVFSDYLGGCPQAEIVPVRISSSVVHLWTGTMAKGIDHAVATGCDVVSISMGGLPSRAWSAAVNNAYEAGLIVVAAAGNNFGGIPTKRVIWPARFKRVIAACGVTAEQGPYFKRGLHFKMQGNFEAGLSNTLAAYTPNAPWAELGCKDIIDLDGAGTSSATPQIAAAAALLIAKHKDKLARNWRRVEAVRHALLSSADKSLPDNEKYYGNGVLKTFDALSVKLPSAKKLVAAPVDEITFPLFTRLPGWQDLEPARAAMYEVEACQLYFSNARLQELYPELADGITGDATEEEVVGTMCDLPNISHKLRGYLLSSINK